MANTQAAVEGGRRSRSVILCRFSGKDVVVRGRGRRGCVKVKVSGLLRVGSSFPFSVRPELHFTTEVHLPSNFTLATDRRSVFEDWMET